MKYYGKMAAHTNKRRRGYSHTVDHHNEKEFLLPPYSNRCYPSRAEWLRPPVENFSSGSYWNTEYQYENSYSYSARAYLPPAQSDNASERPIKRPRKEFVFAGHDNAFRYSGDMMNSPYQGPVFDSRSSGQAQAWDLDVSFDVNFHYQNPNRPCPSPFIEHTSHSNVQNCQKYIYLTPAQMPETDGSHQWTLPRSNTSLGINSPGYSSSPDISSDHQMLTKTTHTETETIQTVLIHGKQREIRYYGEQAVVLMADDDPRLLSFAPGQRKVYINNFSIDCQAGADYITFTSNGRQHKVKLGSPTREVYINGRWFSCPFNAPPSTVYIGDEYISLALQGPALKLKTGSPKNHDHLAGKINLTIDGGNSVPVYLDEEVQLIDVGGKSVGLQFKDSLRSVVIDGALYSVNFGGQPVKVNVGGKLFTLRFSALPKWVKPGMVFKTKGQVFKSQVTSQPSVDVNQLVAKLMEKGLIPASKSNAIELPKQDIKEINLSDSKVMKVRNAVLISKLYDGKQCETCGLRFADDKHNEYAAHMQSHLQEKATGDNVKGRQWYIESIWKTSVH